MAVERLPAPGRRGLQKDPTIDMARMRSMYGYLKNRHGMSAEEFSRMSGVPYWTVRGWRKQLREEPVTIHIESGTSHEAVLEMMRLSGLSMRSFSNASGIPYYTLRSWHRKERDGNAPSTRSGKSEKPASGLDGKDAASPS